MEPGFVDPTNTEIHFLFLSFLSILNYSSQNLSDFNTKVSL